MGNYNQYAFPLRKNKIHYIKSEQQSIDYKYKSGFTILSASAFIKQTSTDGLKCNIQGIELFSKFRITNNFEAELSYTFLNAEIDDNEIKYPSEYDMDYFVRGSFKYKFPANWEFSSIFIFRQGIFHQPVGSATYMPYPDVWSPEYLPMNKLERLPDYSNIDISITKIWPLSSEMNLIGFANVSNLLNNKNVRERNYNSDYTTSFDEYFSQRTIYFGAVLNF